MKFSMSGSLALFAYGIPLPLAAKSEAVTASMPMASTSILDIVQVIFGLLFIIGLIIGMAWIAKRYGGLHAPKGPLLKVVAQVAIGTRERAVLLEVGSTQLLVGIAPGHVRTLHVLDKPVTAASLQEPTSSKSHAEETKGFPQKMLEAMRERYGL